ncbi:MAG: glutamate--cysteine ligase, partial [Leptospiraceae bacterium]|nr:glutamate--cysteine ligase [Leptospiraceae bacterium]
MNRLLAQKILQHESRIDEWLRAHEKKSPFYLSADVRDAGFKVCPIDANLYPAGFNNLHPEFHGVAAQSLRNALADNGVYPESKLLVVSEEHTRNLFYLENLHVLGHIFEMAGFAVEFASQFVLPDVEYENGLCRLVTAKNNTVVLLHPELAAERLEQFAAIILNHDSSSGTAEWIQAAHKPVLPPWQAGWHSRSKACHFVHYRNLVAELAHIAGLDPWFLSALDAPVRDVDINLPKDRERVAEAAEKLLAQIAEKYAEYGIREKPYVFLKSDHGTYGMAMLT